MWSDHTNDGSSVTDEPRAWQVVLESIERDLLDGRLRPGDHLPGERALSADLGVGRSSVREALRVLEVLGLIRTATGSGPNSGARTPVHFSVRPSASTVVPSRVLPFSRPSNLSGDLFFSYWIGISNTRRPSL